MDDKTYFDAVMSTLAANIKTLKKAKVHNPIMVRQKSELLELIDDLYTETVKRRQLVTEKEYTHAKK